MNTIEQKPPKTIPAHIEDKLIKAMTIVGEFIISLMFIVVGCDFGFL